MTFFSNAEPDTATSSEHSLTNTPTSTATDALATSQITSTSDISASMTDLDLFPWVTVDASGHASTVTPILTTIDGKTITIDAAPATITATSDPSIPETTSRTSVSGDVPKPTGGGAFEICHNLKGKFAPFCKPENGSSVYIDETYYGQSLWCNILDYC